MLGIRFIKIEPTNYVLKFKKGNVVKKGAGLSFFYYAPTASLVIIPVGTIDIPFIFEEVTSDFQEVTIQGQLTYRVADPELLSSMMNFTMHASGKGYATDDPQKLQQRLINLTQVNTRAIIKAMPLREALGQSDALVDKLTGHLRASSGIRSLGLEIIGLSILAIRPTAETARALEAEAREKILREADEAIYARRNAAVEQERAIKENELNTEIAVENKKRQIRETEMAANIALEDSNKKLVALRAANAKEEADARAYGISSIMDALAKSNPKLVEAIISNNLDPAQLVAQGFKDLATNAEKIGELNMSPELLTELIDRNKRKK